MGPLEWSGSRDQDGHRTYRVRWQVVSNSSGDGPAAVMTTPGLPLPGTIWSLDNDIDMWAWCRPDMDIRPRHTSEPNYYWDVEQTFSTKPPDLGKPGTPGGRGEPITCSGSTIQNPLLEPPRISGTFAKYTREITHDIFNRPIRSSSHEPLRGAALEFDEARPTVNIEMNFPFLNQLIFQAINHINLGPMWGCPARTIKCANITWERKYYGSCFRYYTLRFEFEINYETWDRWAQDEGSRVLNGKWNATRSEWLTVKIGGKLPNPRNPAHFVEVKDRFGNNAPDKILLDGAGKPYIPPANTIFGVNPGTDCGGAVEVALNQVYSETGTMSGGELAPSGTPLTISGSHFYKVPASERSRRVVVSADEDSIDQVEINIWKPGCAQLADDITQTATKNNRAYRSGKVTAGDMIVEISGGAGIEYAFIIEGDYNTSQAGRFLIQGYKPFNFLLLGIPSILW